MAKQDEKTVHHKADEPKAAAKVEPVTGMTEVDTKAREDRHAAVEETNEASRQADNTARREQQAQRPPNSKELEELRKAKFGDKAGSVHLDTDPATGETKLVYVDGDGKATSGGVFKPKKGA